MQNKITVKMKRITIILLTITMMNGLIAQNIGTQQTGAVTIRDLFDPAYNNDASFDGKYRTIEGSPYWSDEWLNGNIILEDGTVFSNVALKLDLYQNRLIIDHEGQETVVNKAMVDQFRLGRSKFINATGFGYIEQVLTGEQLNLYKKTIVTYEEGEVATGYNAGATKPKFKREEELLIMEPLSREISILPSRKKDIYETLSAYTEQDLKSTKLNPRKADELVDLLKLINK